MGCRSCGRIIASRRPQARNSARTCTFRTPSWCCARATTARSIPYSALYENDRKTPTGLAGYLRERGLTRIVLVGLALDFCVRWSAEDAHREGFGVVVIPEACRGIDVEGSMQATLASFRRDEHPLCRGRRGGMSATWQPRIPCETAESS